MSDILITEKISNSSYALSRDAGRPLYVHRFSPSEIMSTRSVSAIAADYMASANQIFDNFEQLRKVVAAAYDQRDHDRGVPYRRDVICPQCRALHDAMLSCPECLSGAA